MLSLQEAYELVASGDKRPLLVLRECELCKGSDHALLNRSLDNEQTVMLTHWFHCVKLPPNVLDGKHPFFNLFLREKEGERLPHLYFCDPDGANKAPLPGDQSQAQLWETMYSFLDRCYERDAKKSIKELRQLLSQYDTIDSREEEIRGRMDKEIEKNGPDSAKLAKCEADLKKLAKEREELVAKEKKLRDLALIELHAPKAAAPEAAGTK